MTNKICKSCNQPKPVDQFKPHRSTTDGLTTKCSACVTEYNRKYYDRHKTGIKAQTAQYRKTNPEKTKKSNAAGYQKYRVNRLLYERDKYQRDPSIAKLRAKQWREDNPDRVAANLAKRRAAKKQAIPRWANITNIRKLYTEAQQLTENTGVEYQVDHIVPLNSKVVCGLHCEDNLRVITAKENNSKNNKLLEELF